MVKKFKKKKKKIHVSLGIITKYLLHIWMFLYRNTRSEKFFALLDGMESDLEDDMELMNDSDTEFVFERKDSEKDDVSNYQPKSILIPKGNIHVIEGRGENPENSEEESQEHRELISLKQKKNLKEIQQKRG